MQYFLSIPSVNSERIHSPATQIHHTATPRAAAQVFDTAFKTQTLKSPNGAEDSSSFRHTGAPLAV